MVLERGDQDLVPGLQVRSSVRARDKVDRLGGSADKDDLAFARGIDELLHGGSGMLIRPGGALAEFVNPSMNVRAIKSIKTIHGVDDGLRLLRRCRVVQIDQRLAVHLLMQSRKIPAGRGNSRI